MNVVCLAEAVVRTARLHREVLSRPPRPSQALPVCQRLIHLRVEVTPEQASHALYSVRDMVRCRHVDARPAKAVAKQPALLFNKVVEFKLVIDETTKISDRRLTLVLLIQLRRQQQAAQRNELDMRAHLPIT